MSLLHDMVAFLHPPDGRPAHVIEQDIVDELRFHVEMRTEENVRRGMSQSNAREDAERRFGDFDGIRRACRHIQLGERIMLQRVQVGLTVAMLIAVAALAIGFWRQQAQYDATIREMRDSLRDVQTGLVSVMQSAAPVVIETAPAVGATEVDPALSEISVTFNKPMMDKTWSWCETEHAYPDSAGDIHYQEDQRTCVMPVKLEHGTEYVLTINSENFKNFKDQRGQPAVPFVLYFTTRAAE